MNVMIFFYLLFFIQGLLVPETEIFHESSSNSRDYEIYDSESLLPTGQIQNFLSKQFFALYAIMNMNNFSTLIDMYIILFITKTEYELVWYQRVKV